VRRVDEHGRGSCRPRYSDATPGTNFSECPFPPRSGGYPQGHWGLADSRLPVELPNTLWPQSFRRWIRQGLLAVRKFTRRGAGRQKVRGAVDDRRIARPNACCRGISPDGIFFHAWTGPFEALIDERRLRRAPAQLAEGLAWTLPNSGIELIRTVPFLLRPCRPA